jgi:hypothetical protein
MPPLPYATCRIASEFAAPRKSVSLPLVYFSNTTNLTALRAGGMRGKAGSSDSSAFFFDWRGISAAAFTRMSSHARNGDWRPLKTRRISPRYRSPDAAIVRIKQEDNMNFVKLAASAAALSLTLGATAAYAQSSEPANVVGCMHMAKKVSAALDANMSSPNYAAARQNAADADGLCSHAMYKNGLATYDKALGLLGAS